MRRMNIAFLKNYSQTVRFTLTCIIVAVLAVPWYVFFYNPLSVVIAFYAAQKADLASKKPKLLRIAKAVGHTPQEVDMLEKEQEHYAKRLSTNVHANLEKVLACFKKHAVTVLRCKMAKKEEYIDAPFSSVLYECGIQSSYENIVLAIKDLEELHPIVVCKACELKRTDGGCCGQLGLRLFLKSVKKKTKDSHENTATP